MDLVYNSGSSRKYSPTVVVMSEQTGTICCVTVGLKYVSFLQLAGGVGGTHVLLGSGLQKVDWSQ